MLSTKLLYSANPSKKIDAQPTKMIKSLINTDISISTVFNTTEASVRDIMSLRAGDVIQLQHKIDEPLVVKFQHIPKFHASMGKYKNNLAVKILDVIKGDEEHE